MKQGFPSNRVVVFLTPLLFAPGAAFLAGWLSEHFPGLPALDQTETAALMGLAFLAAWQQADRWLKGWQKHEERQAGGTDVSVEVSEAPKAAAPRARPKPKPRPR